MKLELKDLYLYPLTADELSLWLNDLSLLEERLKCKYCAEPIDELLKDVVQSQLILGIIDLPENWVWFTYWFLIRYSDNKIIGTLSFKGKPDYKSGEIEIGYSLGNDYRGKGYMTEAVSAICEWALQQPKVKTILAETKPDNYKSQKLLERCYFEKYKQTVCSIWFKKTIYNGKFHL